jgi:hypothetical protein
MQTSFDQPRDWLRHGVTVEIREHAVELTDLATQRRFELSAREWPAVLALRDGCSLAQLQGILDSLEPDVSAHAYVDLFRALELLDPPPPDLHARLRAQLQRATVEALRREIERSRPTHNW